MQQQELDFGLTHIDHLGARCKSCKKGTYKETSIYSNWDGWVQCPECSDRVDRYIKIDSRGIVYKD